MFHPTDPISYVELDDISMAQASPTGKSRAAPPVWDNINHEKVIVKLSIRRRPRTQPLTRDQRPDAPGPKSAVSLLTIERIPFSTQPDNYTLSPALAVECCSLEVLSA